MTVSTTNKAPELSYGQSLLWLVSIFLVLLILRLPHIAWAQGHADLSGLDEQTRKQVKAACYFRKLEGDRVYSECLIKEARKRNKSVGLSDLSNNDGWSDLPKVRWKEGSQNNSTSRSERPSASKLFKDVERSVYLIRAAASAESLKAGENVSQGSAVAISKSLVLTNCHVIEAATAIVLVSEKTVHSATLRAKGNADDSCILETGVSLEPISALRRYKSLKIGETVYSIGSPFGLSNTLGEGIVSGLRVYKGTRYVQTSAPISPGSSGGGLFDTAGSLVGITTFHLKDMQNLNFAIAAEEFWK